MTSLTIWDEPCQIQAWRPPTLSIEGAEPNSNGRTGQATDRGTAIWVNIELYQSFPSNAKLLKINKIMYNI